MGFRAFDPPAPTPQVGEPLLSVDLTMAASETLTYALTDDQLADYATLMVVPNSGLKFEVATRARLYEFEAATPSGLTVVTDVFAEVTRSNGGVPTADVVWRLPCYLPLFGGDVTLRVANSEVTTTPLAFDVYGLRGVTADQLRQGVSRVFGDTVPVAGGWSLDVPTVPPGYSGVQITGASRDNWSIDAGAYWVSQFPDLDDDLTNVVNFVQSTAAPRVVSGTIDCMALTPLNVVRDGGSGAGRIFALVKMIRGQL